MREACGHPGFRLLAFGFFARGFQEVCIGVRLPTCLIDKNLPAIVGTIVLALVGAADLSVVLSLAAAALKARPAVRIRR